MSLRIVREYEAHSPEVAALAMCEVYGMLHRDRPRPLVVVGDGGSALVVAADGEAVRYSRRGARPA